MNLAAFCAGDGPTIDLPWSSLALAFVIVLGAATIKGTAGFGLNLVSLPLLILFLDPKLAVVVIVPLAFLIDVSIVRQTWHRIQWGRTLPMILLGAVGIPLGNYVLLVTPAAVLKLVIAVVILLSAVLMALGFSVQIARERLASGAVGFVAGVLGSSTAIAAPPVVLLLMNQRVQRDDFRPSMASFLIMINLMATVSFTASGAITTRSLLLDLMLVPAALLGFLLATRLLPHINPYLFRRGVLVMIIAASISALVSAAVTL